MIYMRDGGVQRIKDNYFLAYLEDTDEGRQIMAVSDMHGNDNLQLLGIITQLVANSVRADLPPIVKGQAYATVLDTLKQCAQDLFEAHTEEIALYYREQISEDLKKKILIPGRDNLQ